MEPENIPVKRGVGRPKKDRPPKEKKPIGRPKGNDPVISEGISDIYKIAPQDIIRRLRTIKSENNLSFRSMAELLSTPNSPVYYTELSHIFRGRATLSTKVIIKIVFIMGYSPYWLLGGVGAKKVSAPANIITDIKLFRVELETMEVKSKIRAIEVSNLYKEIEHLKQEIKELKSKFK